MMRDRYPENEIVWKPPVKTKNKNQFGANIHTGRIIQILDNLLVNAISFNPPNRDIEIKLDLKGRVGKKICFSIHHNGVGIPEANLDTIFNRFYSQRPNNEAFGHHSGLELSIARQIAEAHGGKLYAGNSQKRGAIFFLELPVSNRV